MFSRRDDFTAKVMDAPFACCSDREIAVVLRPLCKEFVKCCDTIVMCQVYFYQNGLIVLTPSAKSRGSWLFLGESMYAANNTDCERWALIPV